MLNPANAGSKISQRTKMPNPLFTLKPQPTSKIEMNEKTNATGSVNSIVIESIAKILGQAITDNPAQIAPDSIHAKNAIVPPPENYSGNIAVTQLKNPYVIIAVEVNSVATSLPAHISMRKYRPMATPRKNRPAIQKAKP